MIRSQMQKAAMRGYARRSLVRNIVTFQAEPPLESSVPERPCSVALVQDRGFYGEISSQLWEDQLLQLVPNAFGMSFASLEIAAQEELQQDLSNTVTMNPLVVLIARGPLVSWWAQLYLESYPLAGMILVDPLPLDWQK